MCGASALWPVGVALHLAFWVLVIGGIVWLVRRGPRWQVAGPVRRSLDVLGKRYARGEIDQDEYLQRRAVLDQERG